MVSSNVDTEKWLACLSGEHELKSIYIRPFPYDSTEVVRWCRICGSIVVDLDIDRRTFPGKVMKIKSPLITKSVIL